MTQASSDLRFCEAAQNALAFLVEDHGFSTVAASELRVRYESKTVYIEMLHGLRDCEVHINFGRLDRQEEYSFTLFLELVNPAVEKSLGDRMVNTPDTVAATVDAVAKALQSEGQGIIKGVDELFERMRDVRWWHFCPEALE